MEIQDAIDYLENKKNNLEYDNQEKYIEYQIECLEDLKVKNNPHVPSELDFFPGSSKVAPYYMRAQTIPITALQNPRPNPAWRHGKQMEDDPFEEMFLDA